MTKPPRTLPDPVTEPVINTPRAAAILDLSPRGAYLAVERGDIPSFRVGKAIRIPTRKFLQQFFPDALATESFSPQNSAAPTRGDTPPSHTNVTGAGGQDRRGLAAVRRPSDAA